MLIHFSIPFAFYFSLQLSCKNKLVYSKNAFSITTFPVFNSLQNLDENEVFFSVLISQNFAIGIPFCKLCHNLNIIFMQPRLNGSLFVKPSLDLILDHLHYENIWTMHVTFAFVFFLTFLSSFRLDNIKIAYKRN